MVYFFGFFIVLNFYIIKKVDIYKGSIFVEFGGRLLFVFDVFLKIGNFNKFEGEGGIGFVISNLMIFIFIIKGKLSFIVGGRGSYLDWILKSLDDEKLKNS